MRWHVAGRGGRLDAAEVLRTLGPWSIGLIVVLVLLLPPGGFWDFNGSYYPAALLARHAQSPYLLTLANLHHQNLTVTPAGGLYVYPPVLALLLAPLTLLTPHAAGFAWYGINLILLACSAWMLAALWFPQPARARTAGMLWLFLLALFPVQIVLYLGQADIATLTATIAGLLLASRAARGQSTPWTAWGGGALLATATLFKLYPAILLLYYLYKRQYRLLGGALVAGLGWLMICAALLGTPALRDYVTVLLQGGGPTFTATVWAFGPLAILDRILSANPYTTPLLTLPQSAVFLLYLAWVVLVLGICTQVLPRRVLQRTLSLEMLLCVTAALLTFPKLEFMHLSLLAVAIPGLWAWIMQRREPGRTWQLPSLFLTALYLSDLAHAHYAQQDLVWFDLVLTGLLIVSCTRLSVVAARPRAQRRALPILVGLCFLLNTECFMNVASWPGVPMSGEDAMLGGLQFYMLILVAGYASLLLLSEQRERAVPQVPQREG